MDYATVFGDAGTAITGSLAAVAGAGILVWIAPKSISFAKRVFSKSAGV